MFINITYIACFKPVRKPQKRHKYCVNDYQESRQYAKTWEKKTKDRVPWRDEVIQDINGFEARRNDYEMLTVLRNMGWLSHTLPQRGSKDNLACNIFGRICQSKECMTSHFNSHRWSDAAAFLENFTCRVCGMLCSYASV